MIKSYDDKFRNYKQCQKKDAKPPIDKNELVKREQIVYDIVEVDGKERCVCRQLPEE